MPKNLRHRLAALICAGVAVAASLSTAPAASGSAAPAGARPGLTRLLAEGVPTAKGIATFGCVPTAGQVSGLRALGLTVQPMRPYLSSSSG